MATTQSTGTTFNLRELRKTPQATRCLYFRHWSKAWREDGFPDILKGPAAGGAGMTAAASAALFYVSLFTAEERQALATVFDHDVLDRAWRESVQWYVDIGCSPALAAERAGSQWKSGKQIQLVAWLHRSLDRQGLLPWVEVWGAAALWSFLRLPTDRQWKLIRHVEEQHAEALRVDAEAIAVVRRIFDEARPEPVGEARPIPASKHGGLRCPHCGRHYSNRGCARASLRRHLIEKHGDQPTAAALRATAE